MKPTNEILFHLKLCLGKVQVKKIPHKESVTVWKEGQSSFMVLVASVASAAPKTNSLINLQNAITRIAIARISNLKSFLSLPFLVVLLHS